MTHPSDPSAPDSLAALALRFLALALPLVFNAWLLFYALVGVVFEGDRYLRWEAEFRTVIGPAVGGIVGFCLIVLVILLGLRSARGPLLWWGTVANAALPLLVAAGFLLLT